MKFKLSNKLLGWSIILLPILNVYKGLTSYVELGTTLVIVAFVITCIKNRRIVFIGNFKIWIYLYIYAIVMFPFSFSLANRTVSLNYAVLRLMQDILCAVICYITIVNGWLDGDWMYKWYRVFVIIVIVAGVAQFFSYYIFHKNLNLIYINAIANTRYEEILQRAYSNKGLYRPRSVFLEPAHFFEYIWIYLVYSLFSKNKKNRIVNIVFAVLGTLITGSGQGLALLVFLVGIICLLGFDGKIHVSRKEVLLRFLPLLLVGFSINIPFIYQAIDRMINLQRVGGNAIVGRSAGYIYFMRLGTLQKIIGCGYANTRGSYQTSISFILNGLGAIGLLLIVSIFFVLFRKARTFSSKVMVMSLAVLSVTSSAINSTSLLFNLIFVIMLMKSDRKGIGLKNSYEDIGSVFAAVPCDSRK